jgi:hypothetical protein
VHAAEALPVSLMRCPDPPVHPPASSALRGPLLALAVLAAVAVTVWALAAVAPFLAAAAVAGVVLVVPLGLGLRWSARLAVVHWPARERAAVSAAARENVALPAPPLAIGAPVVTATVLANDYLDSRKQVTTCSTSATATVSPWAARTTRR